ncbi:hypothetical protein C0J52_01506 [Blattella germanica]|nr:hypothetical protein C0J52_01506 [Blattella germanica]
MVLQQLQQKFDDAENEVESQDDVVGSDDEYHGALLCQWVGLTDFDGDDGSQRKNAGIQRSLDNLLQEVVDEEGYWKQWWGGHYDVASSVLTLHSPLADVVGVTFEWRSWEMCFHMVVVVIVPLTYETTDTTLSQLSTSEAMVNLPVPSLYTATDKAPKGQ